MLLYILIALIKSILYKESNIEDSFSFMNHNKKQLTLQNPKNYILSKQIHHILGKVDTKESANQWYYVHFLTNDFSEIQKYISIQASDQLIKNTFILFLSPTQLEKIANISLVKRIESNEKYSGDERKLEKLDHLIVTTSSKFELPKINDDYNIENKKNGDSYIIRVIRNELDAKEFLKKKKKIIQYLSEIPEVKSISTYTVPVAQNAIISGYTQKNRYDFKLHSSSSFYYLDRYLNNNGITGKNQIVTITDTPIDFYHKMLYDDQVQLKFKTHMPNHRKIVYYNFPGNFSDLMNKMEEDEHGTHVAGTVAGQSSCLNDEKGTHFFNGNAPDAKIIYAGHFNEVDLPEIIGLMKNYSSRISTNSWSNPDYDNAENFLYGHLASQNSELTIIFSSGNRYHKAGNFSTGDPPSSKNVLTVGSIADFYIDDEIYNITSKKDPSLWLTGGHPFQSKTDPWFSGSIGTEPGKTDILVVDLDKGDQCNLLQSNLHFVVYGKNIDWINSCEFNHSRVLRVYDTEKINKILDSQSAVHISKIIEMNWTKRVTKSFYSSTGPGNKGIFKPDVMAVGTKVFSSKAREHSSSPHGCREEEEGDFVQMTGTSMATPNVAGAAALVHDYFSSGNWTDKVTPNGPTTRAILINSCRHPEGSKTPDLFFGHGVVDLSTILPIDNEFGVQITKQKVNPSVPENGHVTSILKIDKKINKDLQITLSYNDPMLNMDSPIPITRDLDLVVTSPSKRVFIGDHLPNGDAQHFSTNEKVIIRKNELEDGDYVIHIYGGHFADSKISESSLKQEFSVVASGPIKNGYLEFNDISNECPCDKCDSNRPGFCVCNETSEIGPLCQAKIDTFNGVESAFYVGPSEIKRIRFISPKNIKYVFSKSRNPGHESTIWVSKSCHFTLNEYEINGMTNDEKSDSFGEETKVGFGTKEVCIAIFNNNYSPANYIIQVSDKSRFRWFVVIFWCMFSAIVILIVFVSYLCCCRKGCCCRCCRCCRCCNKEMDDTDTTSQFALNDKLINNN